MAARIDQMTSFTYTTYIRATPGRVRQALSPAHREPTTSAIARISCFPPLSREQGFPRRRGAGACVRATRHVRR